MKSLVIFLIVLALLQTTVWAQTGHTETAQSSKETKVQKFVATLGRASTTAGKLSVYPDGNLHLVPAAKANIAVVVSNPNDIAQTALGLPLKVEVEPVSAEAIKIKSVSLEAVVDWSKQKRNLPEKQFSDLHEAFGELDKVQKAAFTPDETRTGLVQVAEAAKVVEREIVKAYMGLKPRQKQERRTLIRTFRSIRQADKAIYERDNRYPPESYQRIYKNSRGAVAIGRVNQNAFCSGVLVTEDIILTAKHCVEGKRADQLEVLFDYELDLLHQALPVDRYLVAEVVKTGSDNTAAGDLKLDFALVRVKPNDKGERPGTKWPIQCLSMQAVQLDDPLYVIGHPLGYPRTVHDNAFVYFPFQANEDKMSELRLLVEAELAEDPSRESRLKEFIDSYRKRKLPDGSTVYELYSLRWTGQPSIGADSDTFHGNSGSPAFDRRSHDVIGILFAGESDVETPYKPGWKAHEAILPAPVVMERLDRVLPEWKKFVGVCIK